MELKCTWNEPQKYTKQVVILLTFVEGRNYKESMSTNFRKDTSLCICPHNYFSNGIPCWKKSIDKIKWDVGRLLRGAVLTPLFGVWMYQRWKGSQRYGKEIS